MIFHRMLWHILADWLCFKSLIWVECHLRGFLGNNSTIQERIYKKPMCNMDELKCGLVVKVWADFDLTIVDRAIDQWRKRLQGVQAYVKAKGQHFEQLL